MANITVSRDLRKMMVDLDIEIVKARHSKHIVAHLRNRYGVTAVYVMPSSASCHRARKNIAADFRNFSRRRVSDVR